MILTKKRFLISLFLFFFIFPVAHATGCNFSSAVSYDEQNGTYFFNSWFFYDNASEAEDITLTLFNQKENLLIFSDQQMSRIYRGNFVYSKELFLGNGIYSYTLTNVSKDCFRTFFFQVENASEVINYGVQVETPVNADQTYIIAGLVVLLLTIVGVFYVLKKKR